MEEHNSAWEQSVYGMRERQYWNQWRYRNQLRLRTNCIVAVGTVKCDYPDVSHYSVVVRCNRETSRFNLVTLFWVLFNVPHTLDHNTILLHKKGPWTISIGLYHYGFRYFYQEMSISFYYGYQRVVKAVHCGRVVWDPCRIQCPNIGSVDFNSSWGVSLQTDAG
jgi:hypothetical protein